METRRVSDGIPLKNTDSHLADASGFRFETKPSTSKEFPVTLSLGDLTRHSLPRGRCCDRILSLFFFRWGQGAFLQRTRTGRY